MRRRVKEEEKVQKEEIERKEEEKTRKSKNGKINREERRLLDFIKKRGWSILNGETKGDENRQYTYTESRENTIIDAKEKAKKKIRKLEMGKEIQRSSRIRRIY